MGKTVTFSFNSIKFEGAEAIETYSFEQLGIDEDLDEQEQKKAIDEVFQAWLWDKLNLSYSIVVNDDINLK